MMGRMPQDIEFCSFESFPTIYIFEYIYFGHITLFITITKNEHYTRFLYGELMSIKFCGVGIFDDFMQCVVRTTS